MLKKDGAYSSTHYISQTYFPGQSDQFKLTPIEKDPQFRQIKTLIELDVQEDKKIDAEFYEAWEKNIKYKQLTLDSGVELLSNFQILENYERWLFGKKSFWKRDELSFSKYSLLINETSPEIKSMVLKVSFRRYLIKEISQLLCLDDVVWR